MKNSLKGIIAIVALTAIFGSLGIFGRYFNTGFSLFTQVFLRIFVASLLGLVFFKKDLHFEKLKKISLSEWGLLIFRSFTNYISGVVLFTLAALNTKLGNVSVIQSLPFVALFGFLFFGEIASKKKVLFILLAFIGVVIMSLNNTGNFSSINRGDIIALIASVSFAVCYITRKWHSDLLNNKEMTTIMSFIASLFLLMGIFIFREPLTLSSFTMTTSTIILIAGAINIIALFLINYGFQHVEGSLASNLFTLEAVFGTLFGFIIYREIPTIFEITGSVLIIVSVILLNRLEARGAK